MEIVKFYLKTQSLRREKIFNLEVKSYRQFPKKKRRDKAFCDRLLLLKRKRFDFFGANISFGFLAVKNFLVDKLTPELKFLKDLTAERNYFL